jgi:uncharacterized RDD family membrane protein YckC
MKCPKCGYLAFETVERCRNCGYEFSLASPAPAPLDFTLDRDVEQPRASFDLNRIIGGPAEHGSAGDLPLFGADDAPLITAPSRPRTPLGVRRSTVEVPRARPRAPKSAAFDEMLFESARPATDPAGVSATATGGTPAAPSSRIMAGIVDVALMSALDALVLYFTLRLCGLTTSQIAELPVLPFAAFLLLLNGGYFVAFTAVGGQSIGKMAFGLKVITQDEDEMVPVGRATIRTLAYFVSALPLGAGFLPGVISADRLALHDRLAHTRVVRPSSS